MEKHVKEIYEKFDAKRKKIYAQLADKQDLEDLKQLEEKIKINAANSVLNNSRIRGKKTSR